MDRESSVEALKMVLHSPLLKYYFCNNFFLLPPELKNDSILGTIWGVSMDVVSVSHLEMSIYLVLQS